MSETTWQRLYRLVEARREHLGITRNGLKALGGPSSEWVRKLQHEQGRPSTKQAASLRALDTALNWPLGTSWGLLVDDRTGWSADILEDEEAQLVYSDDQDAPRLQRPGKPATVVEAIRRLFDAGDPMAGATEEEWAELMAAIEARRPKRGRASRRRTG